MKESTWQYLISIAFLFFSVSMSVKGLDSSSDISFIAACIFWCSGCVLEKLEEKR